jgi:transcriptional regulator with XRE-family HTH domain
VLEHIGANVRAYRVKLGLSQAQLAELVEREPSYLQKIEYGDAVPSVPTLVRLARALGVEIARLFQPRRTTPRKKGRPTRRKG